MSTCDISFFDIFLTFHLIMRIVYFYDENRKSRDIEENMKLEVKLQ